MPRDSDSHGFVDRRNFLRAAGASGALGLAGCLGGGNGSSENGGGGTTGSGGNSSTAGGGGGLDEITVGLLEPLSGVYSLLGQGEVQGAELAAKDLEEELGITINVKKADTEVDPATGVDKLQRLVTRDNIDVAMGGVSSSVAIKMGQWASQNGVFFVASGSHSDATTGSSCAKYMFRTPSSNTMLARTAGSAFAEYADSWTLMYADYTWGQTGRDAMAQVLKDQGASVTTSIAAPLDAKDYSQELNRVAQSGADACAIIFAGLAQRKVINQFVNNGLHKDMKMGGPLLEDAVMWGLPKDVVQHTGVWATVWSPAISSGGNIEPWMERVREEYQTTPYSRHYLGYTSMSQMVRAANRAGSTKPDDIRKTMEGHEYSERGILGGTEKWRGCDHQNIKPSYAVRALPKDEMSNDPYKVWYEPYDESKGPEVARKCSETGCSF